MQPESTSSPIAGGPDGRKAAILQLVTTNDGIRVEAVATQLDVSPATIYRDVAVLEQERLLRLDRGSIRTLLTSTDELPLQVRRLRQSSEKDLLAAEAAKLVSPRDAIMVDDSSSALPMFEFLIDVRPLTVISNSMHVAQRVKDWEGTQLVLVGGRYQPWADAFYGTLATSLVNDLRADICFMSDAAVWGSSTYNPIDYVVDMKRTMLSRSSHRVLLLDSSKFQRVAWQRTVSLDQFETIITDASITAPHLEQLRDSGARIIIAGQSDR